MQQIHRSTIGGPSSGAHEVTEREVFILGNACSEHLGYDKFNTLLEAHIGQQQRVLEQLKGQQFAPPLTNHTSIASPQELGPFLNALKPHLPWRSDAGDAGDTDDAEDREDWFVSLQTEGASAVWSATDIMLQLQLHDNEKNMQSENKTENENENGNERKNDGSKHIDNDNDEPDSRDSCANDLTLLQKHRIAVAEASYHGPGSSSLGSFKPFGHGAIPGIYACI